MQSSQPSVFARDDTFFGVCQALGEDLGFNPNYLRVVLPVLLFFYPVPTIAGYAAAGMFVMVLRWLIPNPRVAAGPVAHAGPHQAEPVQEEVRLAA